MFLVELGELGIDSAPCIPFLLGVLNSRDRCSTKKKYFYPGSEFGKFYILLFGNNNFVFYRISKLRGQ